MLSFTTGAKSIPLMLNCWLQDIRNPDKMKEAQAELDEVVGRNRKVEESDTDRLPYLRSVVKEALRLHPVVPLLLPHRASSTCEIAGYMIP